jgi:predicted  nucleic acid-binding Zn-ribbon protein
MTDEALPEPEPSPQPRDPLLALQDLDLSIDRLEHRRAELEGGGEVAAARQRVEELEDQVGTLKLALDSVNREATRYETEVDSYSRRITTEEGRLYDGSVANPKELQSIRAEIDNLRTRRSRTEDDLLGQMERREELEGGIGPLEAELAEARDRLSELRGSSEVELEEIGRTLESRREERVGSSAAVDEETLELYEELRASKKGVGAAAVVGRVCMACHQELSPLEYEQVKNQEDIRRCPNCRRILVFT